MTRQEHVEWCKRRARVHLDRGDWQEAFASMTSDLGKHPETRDHPALLIGLQGIVAGIYTNEYAMREFIEGFN